MAKPNSKTQNFFLSCNIDALHVEENLPIEKKKVKDREDGTQNSTLGLNLPHLSFSALQISFQTRNTLKLCKFFIPAMVPNPKSHSNVKGKKKFKPQLARITLEFAATALTTRFPGPIRLNFARAAPSEETLPQ